MSLLKQRILFLGAGQMGLAIIRGLAAGQVEPSNNKLELGCFDPGASPDALPKDVKSWSSVDEAIAWAEVLVLCVKPQIFQSTCEVWRKAIASTQRSLTVISVMAGVRRDHIAQSLGLTNVVRSMPNLPMTVGKGAVAIALDKTSNESLALAEALFAPVGLTVRVPESYMDAVTAVSGSGPAWVFQFVEGLVQGAVKVGLTRDVSMKLVLATIEGSLELLKQSGKGPGELTAQVCSPGGTTIHGLHALEEGQLRSVLMNAIEAAARRSAELGNVQPAPQ